MGLTMLMGRGARWVAAMAAGLVLTACGGGGGGCTDVFGGGCPPPPTGGAAIVSRITLTLTNANGAPVASLLNTGTERITATVTALDSNNAVVPDAVMSFAVTGNAEIVPAGNATDAGGKLTASVGIGPDRSSRVVTVTVINSVNALSASADFLVTGAKLTASVPVKVVPAEQFSVTYTIEDASGNPMVGERVSLVTSASPDPQVLTADLTGKARFALTAPATVGSLTLTATAAGEPLVNVVDVSTSQVDPAVGPIIGASVAANPSVVAVNTNNTNNATTVRALFTGNANATIPRVRVWFTLPDPNSVGGSFSNNGLVYSDVTGTATTTYIPGAIASPTDGVEVLACYSTHDFQVPPVGTKTCPALDAVGNPVRSVMTKLTVVDQALRLSIGTDELIRLGDVTYIKDFVVVVVDAAGRAKADVEITPKLDLTGFYKGFYAWNGEAWVRDFPNGFGVLWEPVCPNEDLNRNGIMEAGEDRNGNGELDPAGVSITMLGSSKTDAAGKAIVRIEYPRDRATWLDFEITVTGRVSGSEGTALYRGSRDALGSLPAPGDAFINETVAPAFVVSPYGRFNGSCTSAN